MKSFNNDQKYKDQLVAMSVVHEKADEYAKGSYETCSVGCMIKDVNIINGTKMLTDDHAGLAEALDVPIFTLRIVDLIFEGLPKPLHVKWTTRWLTAIPEGKDLSLVLPNFLLKMLESLPTQEDDAIKGVKKVLSNWADTGKVDKEAASDAVAYAVSAVADAVAAVAYANAVAANVDVAYAAVHAAVHAVDAAEAAHAAVHAVENRTVARYEFWEKTANNLIKCIEDMK